MPKIKFLVDVELGAKTTIVFPEKLEYRMERLLYHFLENESDGPIPSVAVRQLDDKSTPPKS